MSLLRAIASFSLVILAACGSVAEMADGPDAGTEPAVPALVSSSPANGAAGVPASAVIEFVFNKPMDQASVLAALETSPFQVGETVPTWNAAGDTLTLTPGQPLARAEGFGADPGEVEPIVHTITLDAGAADLDGNTLAGPVTITFTTQRRMTIALPLVHEATRLMASDGVIADQSVNLLLGDGPGGAYSRALLTFDLSALPADLIGVERASFSARQLDVSGAPYDSLGALAAHHLIFDDVDFSAFAVATLATMGSFSTNAIIESKSIDVTGAVQDDLAQRAARGDRSQYRLQFETDTDGNGQLDVALFAYPTLEMTVVYLTE